MKTINFELSKRLNDLGLLDNIETEYCYYKLYIENNYNDVVFLESGIFTEKEFEIKMQDYKDMKNPGFLDKIKTLTLEEAIEFLPNITLNGFNVKPYFNNKNCWYSDETKYIIHLEKGKNTLEAIEEMLERLINNGLLNKNK